MQNTSGRDHGVSRSIFNGSPGMSGLDFERGKEEPGCFFARISTDGLIFTRCFDGSAASNYGSKNE